MKLLTILNKVVKTLEKLECQYCLIGGYAASIYRNQERLTHDIDFALVANDISKSKSIAEKCIKGIGLKPMVGIIPIGEHEPQRKNVSMITSESISGDIKGSIDIILPELPWVQFSVQRAQYNIINLGFIKIPVITPEDIIISKCYALRNNPDRFKDLDDIKEIFIGVKDLDLDYLEAKLDELALSIPKVLKKYIK